MLLTGKDGSSKDFGRVHLSSSAMMSSHDSGENAHSDHEGSVGVVPFLVSDDQVSSELEDEGGLHLSNKKSNDLGFCQVSENDSSEDFTLSSGILKKR